MSQHHTISDLSSARPADALTDAPKASHWRVVDYACPMATGKMLYAGPLTNPPSLTLPLGLKGWHRLVAGLWGGSYINIATPLKLTGEPHFKTLRRERPSNETIEEVPFGCADLTGRDLILGPPAPGSENTVALAYVRCEPMSDDEVRQVEADCRSTDHRKVIAYNDGISFFSGQRYESKEDVQAVVEPYRHSDVESVFWGLTGDVTTFATPHGRMAGEGMDAAPARGTRQLVANLRGLDAKGINPLVTAMEYAHELGLQFHAYQRMGAGTHHLPNDVTWTGPFYAAHPEWRCVDRNGLAIPRLSYAYSGVRRHWLDLLVEVAGFGVDGINLCFMRGPPFVAYEPPLIDGFQKQFGKDPRQLDEWDEQWLRYRAWPMTEFVRELRRELDVVGAKLGKRLAISATSFPTAAGNLFYGLDVEGWIAEGLLDRLTPYGISRAMDFVDLPYHMNITKGTSCSFWPHLPVVPSMSVCQTAALARAKALEYYDDGAQGLAIWDLNGLDCQGTLGPQLLRLGHIEEMRACEARTDTPDEPVVARLEQLGALDMRVYSVPETHTERLYPNGVPCHIVWWPS